MFARRNERECLRAELVSTEALMAGYVDAGLIEAPRRVCGLWRKKRGRPEGRPRGRSLSATAYSRGGARVPKEGTQTAANWATGEDSGLASQPTVPDVPHVPSGFTGHCVVTTGHCVSTGGQIVASGGQSVGPAGHCVCTTGH